MMKIHFWLEHFMKAILLILVLSKFCQSPLKSSTFHEENENSVLQLVPQVKNLVTHTGMTYLDSILHIILPIDCRCSLVSLQVLYFTTTAGTQWLHAILFHIYILKNSQVNFALSLWLTELIPPPRCVGRGIKKWMQLYTFFHSI